MTVPISDVIKISGRVVDAGSRAKPGVRVELWDRDLLCDDELATATTDADGGFEVQFGAADFGHAWLERKPELYALVYDGTQLLASTRDRAWNELAQASAELLLRVPSSEPAAAPAPAQVIAEPEPASEGSQPITPAQFGERFIESVFTASMIADQAARLLDSPHFRETSALSFGPVKVNVTSDALVGAPSAVESAERHFEVTFPVELHVRIQGKIGPLEVEERFEVSTRVPVELELQLFEPLSLYLAAKPITPAAIDVTIERESWTEFSRGEVDKGVRKALADRFNERLLTGGRSRNIDILALVQAFTQRDAQGRVSA